MGDQLNMPCIRIRTTRGERAIGDNAPCFVIAELSANHNGNFDRAVALVKSAAGAGADAVKIQTYTPDTMTIDSDKPWFRVGEMIGSADNPDLWKGQTLYQLYQKAQTPYAWHGLLKKVAEDLGLVFFSTPYEESAVDFLETLDVLLYKIASYEVTHIPFLKRVAMTGKPVIMSVGFSTLPEIELAVQTLREYGAKDLVLLHCTTSYSRAPKATDANLDTMRDLAERFGLGVGFSDNSAGIEIPIQAVMMGATVIEKHLTLGDSEKVIDGDFSLTPIDFRAMVDGIRHAESARGTILYGPKNESEKGNARYQRSIFVVKDMHAGDPFTTENIRVIRPRFGLEPKHYEEILGKQAAGAIERGTPLTRDLVKQ